MERAMRSRTTALRTSAWVACVCALQGAAVLPEAAPLLRAEVAAQAQVHPGPRIGSAEIDPATRARFTSPQAVAPARAAAHSAQRPDGELALPFETAYTGARMFDLVGIENLLDAEDFPRRIQQLGDEAQADADAQALTAVYRAAAERASVAGGGALRLQALSCGVRVCIGMLVGGDAAAQGDWASHFHREAGLGVAFRYRATTLPGGMEGLRVFFYADPASPAPTDAPGVDPVG